ncbi:NAD-dependent epimerase [Pedobacter sp.]|uniref:NAD-dependent epimerase n=1 Tax=Pedobacter sp. TaxID=1411316 RepID=UPI003D7FA48C
MKVLVTGTAGFIGYHLAKCLLERGDEVVGIDNINDYYDVNLKYGRLAETGINEADVEYGKTVRSAKYSNYQFVRLDLTDYDKMKNIFKICHFDAVCNLAAQAGVRYSITHPRAYIDSNIVGFLNVLECCRTHRIKHLVYASSSSVYGLNKSMPFSSCHQANHPVSLYAATKKSNELMAHTYSHLFNLPTTGLRFFTVYGPWGRPDMAPFLFTKAILEHKHIDVFNNGAMKRDFTYIDDIVDGIVRVIDDPAKVDTLWDGLDPDPSTSNVPYRVFNLGRGESVDLLKFIAEIEKNLGELAVKNYMPMQNGDVEETWADISSMREMLAYNPKTSVADGVRDFVSWYMTFYKVANNRQDVLGRHLA